MQSHHARNFVRDHCWGHSQENGRGHLQGHVGQAAHTARNSVHQCHSGLITIELEGCTMEKTSNFNAAEADSLHACAERRGNHRRPLHSSQVVGYAACSK
jgi:hypothetical protein